MLLATEIPTDEERAAAVAVVPWGIQLHYLTGTARAALANQSIDLIDVALGPNHVRAGLVALYEGLDVLLEASIDLAESAVGEAVFDRLDPFDPLRRNREHLPGPGEKRFPFRVARYGVEDAAVRAASAGDHLTNAYLRLAWEANAARLDEVRACRFDPLRRTSTWADVEDVRRGLERAAADPLSVLPAFELSRAFLSYIGNDTVPAAREYRNEIVHRERPSYREAPAFGRGTRWLDSDSILIKVPPAGAPDEELPALADRRTLVGDAIVAAFDFGKATWDLAVRWLRIVDVWIEVEYEGERPHQVRISTTHTVGAPAHPREARDPAPFLQV